MTNYTPPTVFQYMWGEEVSADIVYDGKTVTVTNHTNDISKLPFGIKMYPDAKDLYDFFEFRCFSRYNPECNTILEELGLSFYDPYTIVKKTHGAQLTDNAWVRFEGERIDFDTDIKIKYIK